MLEVSRKYGWEHQLENSHAGSSSVCSCAPTRARIRPVSFYLPSRKIWRRIERAYTGGEHFAAAKEKNDALHDVDVDMNLFRNINDVQNEPFHASQAEHVLYIHSALRTINCHLHPQLEIDSTMMIVGRSKESTEA